MNDEKWHDVGEVAELSKKPLQQTSEALLQSALEHARMKHALETRMVKLRELSLTKVARRITS